MLSKPGVHRKERSNVATASGLISGKHRTLHLERPLAAIVPWEPTLGGIFFI